MKPCPPPDASPRKPRLAVPGGACDCHAHVFGTDPPYPFVSGREYTPPAAPMAAYRAMLDALGIERAVLVQPSVYGTDNRLLLEVLESGDPRLRGVAVVDDTVTDEELRRMDAVGVRGVRFNLITAGVDLDLEQLESAARRIAPLGWHVQLYVTTGLLPELERRTAGLGVDLVIDHMGDVRMDMGLGHTGFQALLRMLREERCWVKLSSAYRLSEEDVPYTDVVPYARALVEANPGRCVWASDWPHPSFFERPMPNDGDLLDLVADWAPDDATRHRILVDNPARLYGF